LSISFEGWFIVAIPRHFSLNVLPATAVDLRTEVEFGGFEEAEDKY